MATFGEAFSAARSAGKREFTWKGKSYNTMRKGESRKAWLAKLGPRDKPKGTSKRMAKPRARPDAGEYRMRKGDRGRPTGTRGSAKPGMRKSDRTISAGRGPSKRRGVQVAKRRRATPSTGKTTYSYSATPRRRSLRSR